MLGLLHHLPPRPFSCGAQLNSGTVLPSLALSYPFFQAFVLYVFSHPKMYNIFHTHIEQLAGPFFLYLVLESR